MNFILRFLEPQDGVSVLIRAIYCRIVVNKKKNCANGRIKANN